MQRALGGADCRPRTRRPLLTQNRAQVSPHFVPQELLDKHPADWRKGADKFDSKNVFPIMNTPPAKCVSTACKEGTCSYGKCCCSPKTERGKMLKEKFQAEVDEAYQKQAAIREEEAAEGAERDARGTWCAPGRCAQKAAEPGEEPEKPVYRKRIMQYGIARHRTIRA